MSLMTTTDGAFDKEKLELIKRLYCKDATNDELEVFAHICQKVKLDPMLKQIYFMKYAGKMTTITSIDGYRLVADRTGKYSPGKENTFIYDKNNYLFSATATIRKMTPDGSWHDVSATAHMSEYKPKNTNAFWDSKPHIMLGKCAEALALRKAFPADLAGLLTEEEMEQAKDKVGEAEVVQEVSPEVLTKFSREDAIALVIKSTKTQDPDFLLYIDAIESYCDKNEVLFASTLDDFVKNPKRALEKFGLWKKRQNKAA